MQMPDHEEVGPHALKGLIVPSNMLANMAHTPLKIGAAAAGTFGNEVVAKPTHDLVREVVT